MKKLGGLPLSAFVAYSRKRKNAANGKVSKKAKKKFVRPPDKITPALANGKKKKKKCRKPMKNRAKIETEARNVEEPVDGSPSSDSSDVSTGRREAVPSSSVSTQELVEKQGGTSGTVEGSKESKANVKDHKNKKSVWFKGDPVEEAKSMFQWLVHPVQTEDFFKDNWERAPLQIQRSDPSYYKHLMSTPKLDEILRKFHILYTKNIDVTSYSDGQRETHNPPGRAYASVVWDYYANGCSIRMLNPQTFEPKLHALNATLQEFFGCFVGANSYLTPPDSQGFAPHYDDIEAFILQIEGKKRWRLYKPLTDAEYLPRYSSRNYDPSEIGEPILDTVVNAGDLLYFPRGTIHQGETIDGTHSLHVTLSVYQKNSWCDFLEKLLPAALRRASETDSRYREGLPLDYLGHVGYVHSSRETESREAFVRRTKDLLHRLIDHIDVDEAADEMAKGNIHDFLPPVLTLSEQSCSILTDGERMVDNGLIFNRVEIDPDTKIRLVRSHCVRLVEEEEDSTKIYYSTENSKEYREYEPQFLDVEKQFLPGVKKLIRCYPEFVRVEDLPIPGEDDRIQVARDLWEKGIVVTDVPLLNID